LHAIFVGFVISMIFGHAPIIFPAILGTPVHFYKAFHAHFILLHVSLVIRMGGDLAEWVELRKLGGLLNEIAILLFLGMTVYSILKAKKRPEGWVSTPTKVEKEPSGGYMEAKK
jgi:hypothetical protein